MDRMQSRSTGEFDSMVEAVRVGTIVAHDRQAYSRWQSVRRRRAGQSEALTAAALEAGVMALARSHPEYVVMEQ